MIFHLSGTLYSVSEDSVILDVAGVGYQVFISDLVKDQLPPPKQALTLKTYHHIREDQQTLFGFLTLEERSMFLSLISVSGVGPKAGLKILSQFSVDHLIQAILKEDVLAFTNVSGIGKKTAERILIELKDKVAKLPQASTYSTDLPSKSSPAQLAIVDDLIAALKQLGYSQDEIKRAMSKTEGIYTISSLETGIKKLLRNLV